MTTEEKAKAYDEAIKRAKVFKEHLLEINDKGYVDEMDYIFPELAELEDERVRKEIITYLSTAEDRELIPYEDWVAWLEKKGEPTDIPADAVLDSNKDGLIANTIRRKREKQDEQKVSEYDIVKTIKERIIEHFDNHLIIDKCFSIGGLKNDILKIINEVKFAKQSEQNPAWSEEDKKTLERVIRCIENHDYMNVDDIHWLKSLKDRVQSQPSQEWSEEDIDNLNRISVILNDARQVREWWKDERLITKEESDKLITFLKSLRPQNHWKPNEKEMEALEVAIEHCDKAHFINTNPLLVALYEDLKKLREE